MVEILNFLSSNWDTILEALTGIVTAASALAALIPGGGKFKALLNILAINVKNAKPESNTQVSVAIKAGKSVIDSLAEEFAQIKKK